jgi:WD40 repeat protein
MNGAAANSIVTLQLLLIVSIECILFGAPHDSKKNNAADTRREVWAVQVAQIIRDPGVGQGPEHYEIRSLAFSPDGKQLALMVNDSRLLILDVQSPETAARRFDLAGTCGARITWNDRGDALLVCGTIVRLSDGVNCDATGLKPADRKYNLITAFWLDSDHVVRSHTGEILDLRCKPTGTWPLAPAWLIIDVVASKGWILLSHCEGQSPKKFYRYLLLDRTSRRALTGWPMRRVPYPSSVATLAGGAEAFCFEFHDQNDFKHERLICREIEGDTKIPVSKPLCSYRLSEAAFSSTRVVAENWEEMDHHWWEMFALTVGGHKLPVQRGIFDLRSGKLISSWKPRIQDSRSPYITDHPYQCALSPNGDFLAEGGNGGVELYRLDR